MSVLLPVEIGVLAIHVVFISWELAGRKRRKEAEEREEARKREIERKLEELTRSRPARPRLGRLEAALAATPRVGAEEPDLATIPITRGGPAPGRTRSSRSTPPKPRAVIEDPNDAARVYRRGSSPAVPPPASPRLYVRPRGERSQGRRRAIPSDRSESGSSDLQRLCGDSIETVANAVAS